jgi:hypothetical protein
LIGCVRLKNVVVLKMVTGKMEVVSIEFLPLRTLNISEGALHNTPSPTERVSLHICFHEVANAQGFYVL